MLSMLRSVDDEFPQEIIQEFRGIKVLILTCSVALTYTVPSNDPSNRSTFHYDPFHNILEEEVLNSNMVHHDTCKFSPFQFFSQANLALWS